MILNWNGESVKCKLVDTLPHRIKTGDYLLYGGQLCKVITVQKECPTLENLRHHFIQFTLTTRDGKVIPVRGFPSNTKKEVHRAIR